MKTKTITLLLIEDNINDCNLFKNYVQTRDDVKFIGITDSDIEGFEYIKKYSPDAIILDLELQKGSGNETSINLIENLYSMNISPKPKIIVTTVVASDAIYDYLHEKGVDLIFYKKHKNYSVQNVINTLLLFSNYSDKSIPTNINSTDTTSQTQNNSNNVIKNISDLINTELDLIGVGLHLQGRKYLYDAIYYIINQELTNSDSKITVIQHLVSKYKRSNSTISRAMQNAILHAWRRSSLEDLEKYYTAKINYETGIPTPTEFIYYYADKIKKMI